MVSYDPVKLVHDAFGDWEKFDLDTLMLRLGPDAIFMADLKSQPIRGRGAIRALWAYYVEIFASYVNKVVNIVAQDGLIFIERIETVVRRDGRTLVLPVVTIFEVDAAGKITAWRDYWDTSMAAA
jgi:limonene-1,2-epoxide hydrolase